MKKFKLLRGLVILFAFTLSGCELESDDSVSEFIPPSNPLPLEIQSESQVPIDLTVENGYTYFKDVSYDSHERNVFDIFVPHSQSPTPLIIYVHGGGFFTGNKESAYSNPAAIEAVLNSGVAFATINYSLLDVKGFNGVVNDTVGVEKSLDDIKRALQFIRYNSITFNLDSQKVAMYGGSAGAGASLWLATEDDLIDPESDDPVEMQSTRLQAAAAIETQGSYDLVRWDEILQGLSFTIEDAIDLGFSNYLTAFYGLDETLSKQELLTEIYSETNDLSQRREKLDFPAMLDAGDPPIFVWSTGVPAQAPDLSDPQAALGALLHFPTHASIIKQYGDNVGATVTAHLPQLGVVEPEGKTVIEFLLENMN